MIFISLSALLSCSCHLNSVRDDRKSEKNSNRQNNKIIILRFEYLEKRTPCSNARFSRFLIVDYDNGRRARAREDNEFALFLRA